MPKTYAPEVKQAFLIAARAARAGGKGWDEAVKAAQGAGYLGGVGGLKQMVYSKKKPKQASPGGPAPAIKVVRRNKVTGAIEPRKPGRPCRDWENGFLDAGGQFVASKPSKRGKRGKRKIKLTRARPAALAPVAASGLDQIDAIVAGEVKKRLIAAKEAALKAFTDALGV